jgi:hypothetical protein
MALLGALAVLASTAPADAQGVRPSGSVTAHALASPRPDFGGALTGELSFALDLLRVGGFLGVGALPSGEDVTNRVFMPLGLSIGIDFLEGPVGVSLRARGGLWAGATQDVKLAAGGLIGGSAYLLFALGAGASVSVGLDVWGLLGDGETALFAPGLGLTWTPTSE